MKLQNFAGEEFADLIPKIYLKKLQWSNQSTEIVL